MHHPSPNTTTSSLYRCVVFGLAVGVVRRCVGWLGGWALGIRQKSGSVSACQRAHQSVAAADLSANEIVSIKSNEIVSVIRTKSFFNTSLSLLSRLMTQKVSVEARLCSTECTNQVLHLVSGWWVLGGWGEGGCRGAPNGNLTEISRNICKNQV